MGVADCMATFRERMGPGDIGITPEQLVARRIKYARAVRKRAELDEHIKVVSAAIASRAAPSSASAGQGDRRDGPH
jgi:hypothetical protein